MGLDIGMSIQVLLQLVSKQESLAANFTNLIFGSIFMLSLLVSRDPFD